MMAGAGTVVRNREPYVGTAALGGPAGAARAFAIVLNARIVPEGERGDPRPKTRYRYNIMLRPEPEGGYTARRCGLRKQT